MQTSPMFLKLVGRRVVIGGGGEQAAQKVRLMLKTEADITVAAPTLDPLQWADVIFYDPPPPAAGPAMLAEPARGS